MNHSRIILASQSPRRKELLEKMGVSFEAIISNFDEQLDHSRSVEEVAMELALGKALAVARLHPDAIVIGSDTIVFVDGEQLGKPTNESEARAVLKNLAGKVNKVVTGVAIVCLDKKLEIIEAFSSAVFFKPYDQDIHETYLATGDWADKAGSYGLQSGAAPLVDYVVGDFDTILGLPTKPLSERLRTLGVESRPAIVDLKIPIRRAD